MSFSDLDFYGKRMPLRCLSTSAYSFAGASLFSWLPTGVRLSDTHDGFRALSRRALEQVHLRENGFAHATEILQRVRQSRLRFVEVPITVSYTDYSKADVVPTTPSQPYSPALRWVCDFKLKTGTPITTT